MTIGKTHPTLHVNASRTVTDEYRGLNKKSLEILLGVTTRDSRDITDVTYK